MNTKTYQFALENVSCATCVQHIESALKRLPDVPQVQINFAQRTLTITTTHTPETIVKTIEQAGYGAKLMEEVDLSNLKRQEQKYFYQLLIKGLVAGIIGIFLFMTDWIQAIPQLSQPFGQLTWFLIGIMTLIGIIYTGGNIYSGAWKNCKHLHITMDTLIALSTASAWLYSMLVVVFPNIVPISAQHTYFEAAIFIICFIDIGKALEIRAKGKTSEAIERLLGLKVKTACVIQNGQETNIPIENIKVGDIIKVRPGEIIATDGTILEGQSSINEAMLTGEPIPIFKKIGDNIIGGTINQLGSFLFKATKIGKDTVLSQIIQLVQQAQNTKPPIARLADKVASIFVPAVIIIAIIAAVLWAIFGPEPKSNYILLTSMSVLIIACPCALGLAVPISVIVGMGKAAENGILIRNGDALQQIGKLTTIVLDKTGTITEGKPKIMQITDNDDSSNNGFAILQYAASLENYSEHPLASAIITEAQERHISFLTVKDFLAVEGKGIKGEINGKKVLVGNRIYMQENDIAIKQTDGNEIIGTAVYVAVNEQLIGIITIADPIRADSIAAIKKLQDIGLKVVMLTGDDRATAMKVAKSVGITDVIANVLPENKTEHIVKLQQQGEIVAMVGDGINDAPALAKAHVGFALSAGTDVAIESADITLMRNSLHSVADAIAISNATMRNIKQNLFGAFIYNVLCIPIAAGVLYPFTGLLLSPILAAAAMALSDVTVIGNANRLRFWKKK